MEQPKDLPPTPVEIEKARRAAEKQRLKGTLFWDSKKLGTYRKPQSELDKKIRPGFKRRYAIGTRTAW